MIKLTESSHYEIYREYELVLLKIKYSTKEAIIGDFYGDVDKIIISSDEQYCIMAGCGIIVYSLKKQFEQYQYEKVICISLKSSLYRGAAGVVQ